MDCNDSWSSWDSQFTQKSVSIDVSERNKEIFRKLLNPIWLPKLGRSAKVNYEIFKKRGINGEDKANTIFKLVIDEITRLINKTKNEYNIVNEKY